MLPPELKAATDEIKTPSNRILVIVLITAVTSLFGVIIKMYTSGNTRTDETAKIYQLSEKKCLEEALRLRIENDNLKYLAITKSNEDNVRLTNKIAFQDSVKNALENLEKK